MENINNQSQKLEKIIVELLEKMGFPSKIEIKEEEKEGIKNLSCNIVSEESSFLIGQYGINLQSLQHIARLLAKKKMGTSINFTIDVNSYREEKNDSIEKLARSMAEEAILEGKEIVLRPMSPYERRIVHMELSKNSRVKTESIGEGENRKVIIKPVA